MSSQPVINRYLDNRSSKLRVKPNHPQPPLWGGLTKSPERRIVPFSALTSILGLEPTLLVQYFDWGRVFLEFREDNFLCVGMGDSAPPTPIWHCTTVVQQQLSSITEPVSF